MDFILRPWNMGDMENLVRFGNNPLIAKNMTNAFPNPYTFEKARSFIEHAMQGKPANIMAIEIEGKAAGGIGVHPQTDIHCKNAELGYWLGQPFWGHGVVSRAVVQMVEYGFAHWDINRIFARPFGTNIASQKVLEKAGFTLEARFEKTLYKNGEYIDELIYAVRR